MPRPGAEMIEGASHLPIAFEDVSKPVIETIVLATCLISSPLICKEIQLHVTPDQGASLQLPYYRAPHGQI